MKRGTSRLQSNALKNKDNDYSHLEKEYFTKNNISLCDPLAIPPEISSGKKLSATVVVPTGNSTSSIISCLTSIEQSSFNIKNRDKLQVIVVDDGSTDGTWDLIKNSKLCLDLTVIRKKQSGQTESLNTGISIAKNDIIICCDSDMILGFYAIENFMAVHQQFPNVILAGFRSDVSKNDPRVNKDYMRENGTHRYSDITGDERVCFSSSGWPMNMCLASNHFKSLGNKKGLWMRDEDPWLLADLVFGALFSLPKKTYQTIGGYDERLKGWGCSDGYLVSKAISVGSYVLPIYASSGLHISHPDRNPNKWIEYQKNRNIFKKLIRTSRTDKFPDWLPKAKNRITEQIVKKPTKLSFPESRKTFQAKEPKYLKIDSLLAVGRYREVIKIISNQNISDNKDLLTRLGKAQLGLKSYEKAIDIFRNLPKSSHEVLINFTLALAGNGQFTLANKILKIFIQKTSNKSDLEYWNHPPQIHIKQGISYLDQGFTETAIKCFEIALIKQPFNKKARHYISTLQKE